MIYKANDKYRAILRSTWIHDPADGSLLVSAVPDNVPTLVVVGWKTDFETVFAVTGKTGVGYSTYALTGVQRLRGYDGDIPENTSVNCLNNEEFINQYLTYLGIQWKGEWDVGTAYSAGDGVSYEGSSYIALVDDTGTEPPSEGIWQLTTQRGTTWLYGSGVPDNGDGFEGDFYLDIATDNIYIKGASTWSFLVNIEGEAATINIGDVTPGVPGSAPDVTNSGDENAAVLDFTIPVGATWRAGAGAPSDAVGVNGDYYLDTDTSDVYLRSGGTYSIIANIQGDPGVATISAESLKNSTLIEDTTNTDDYAGSLPSSPGSYFTGLKINLKVTNANTDVATLNVNSLGAKSIKKNVSEDLVAGDIKAGQIIPLIYDGTNFQIVGGGGTGGADFLTVQVFS